MVNSIGNSCWYIVVVTVNLNDDNNAYVMIHDGCEERTFLDLLLGTFKNEKNVLNTFISVCNICWF